MYEILPYTLNIAKKMGLIVQPSSIRNYKIDVFNSKTGQYICSIGHKDYFDYPYYMLFYGKEIADNRRRLYKIRHEKDRNNPKYIRGFLSDKLLW
jgi:hypothetical protein